MTLSQMGTLDSLSRTAGFGAFVSLGVKREHLCTVCLSGLTTPLLKTYGKERERFMEQSCLKTCWSSCLMQRRFVFVCFHKHEKRFEFKSEADYKRQFIWSEDNRSCWASCSSLFCLQVKKLQAFKGDADKLTLVDSFMFLLIQVPR